MSQKMLIDASHNEETRVVVIESKKVEDFDFESLTKVQLSGNIYLAKVTRVEPSLQAAFLDYGGNRHGFLAFSEIHPDYYQIPIEERLKIEAEQDEVETDSKSRKVSREKTINSKQKAEKTGVPQQEIISDENEVIKLDYEDNSLDNQESNDNLLVENDLTNDEIIDDEPLVRKQHRKFRIQEVIKVRQILLIQVVKDERGNKGAALTTYLSLAGRYCVLMPNTPRGGGISRKITNLADRKRLKEIANSLSVPEGSGLIIRTAGSNRTKIEIKRDYEYLLRQWEQVRDLTLSSIAPTPIYEEGSLIKRAIRDLYSRMIDEILVEGERGYKEAKDYMKMLMPSHAKNVKRYVNEIPLFSKYEVEDHLAAMFNPIAQLKSGGYIVINVTEALVAVDVNSGRATKESSIEDTALKTNLEAADELSRQIKLRDLAGLIVIDFIDMEERKNNLAVEKRMKDRLKNDRARTQVGRISVFGLLEMSRQRLRPGMIEMSTRACTHCHGTGITRSDESLSLAILRDLEQEGIKRTYSSLQVKTPVDIANYLLNEKRERISAIENRYNISIRVDSDVNLINPDYRLEKNKQGKQTNIVNSKLDSSSEKDPPQPPMDKKNSNDQIETDTQLDPDDNSSKKRRRRRRRPKQRQQVMTQEVVISVSETEDSAPINEATARNEPSQKNSKPRGQRRYPRTRKTSQPLSKIKSSQETKTIQNTADVNSSNILDNDIEQPVSNKSKVNKRQDPDLAQKKVLKKDTTDSEKSNKASETKVTKKKSAENGKETEKEVKPNKNKKSGWWSKSKNET